MSSHQIDTSTVWYSSVIDVFFPLRNRSVSTGTNTKDNLHRNMTLQRIETRQQGDLVITRESCVG